MNRIRRGLLISAMLLASVASVRAVQPPIANSPSPRDQVSSTATKPGIISGRAVILTGALASPVRRARVRLESNTIEKPLVTDTDADGRFRFEGLSPGTYHIGAEKPGYVPVVRQSGDGAGTINLRTGELVSADLLFEHGAALEGRVVTELGDPAVNVVVSALRAEPARDGTRPVVRQTRTDDRGMFRLHTLVAGEYIIDAAASLPAGTSPQPAAASSATHTFYPGSTRVEDASRLTLSTGQDLRGLELSLTDTPQTAVPARALEGADRPSGRARIAGRVTAAAGSRPVPAANVSLIRWDGGSGVQTHVTTDAQGRFEFPDLAAGSYQLTVRASGYAVRDYGQQSPGGSGSRISLADVQAFNNADVALLRTGAIDGRILDEFGDPAPGILIQTARVEFAAGKSRLMPVDGTNQARPTDDLGQFRAFDLPQGDYYLEALSGPFAGEDRAGFAPTFYPGVTIARDAQPVHLGVGTEVPPVVFQLTASPLATVSGRIADASGQPVKPTRLWLLQTYGDDVRAFILALGSATAEGRFEFRNVPAGTYVLQAVSSGGPAGVGFGGARITVDGHAVSDVAVTTTAGATARGHITFEGAASAPSPESIRISVRPVDFVSSPAMGVGLAPSQVNSNGTFEAARNFGRGVLRVDATAPWALKSIMLDGADVTDAVLDFRGKDIEGLELVLTTRMASMTGKVLDDKGPVRDANVIVFADDSTKWGYPSRYLALARPNQDGVFATQALPPGAYLAAALPIAGTEWQDPQFLERLRSVATPIILGEGATRTVDLRLIRQ